MTILDEIPVMSHNDDVAPLLTWGLTVTSRPEQETPKLSIYRHRSEW